MIFYNFHFFKSVVKLNKKKSYSKKTNQILNLIKIIFYFL